MPEKEEHSPAHYMPTLDGVRGLACLLVVMSHLNLMLGTANHIDLGGGGVITFFALSGFLMGTLYFGTICNLETSAKYIVSRFSRITPAFYIAILAYWILYMIIPDFSYEMTPVNMLRHFLFLGTEGVLWSIPPEIQFYGFFLVIWFSYERFKQGQRLWLLFTAVLSAVFILTREQWPGLLLPSKFHIFFFGFLAALALKWLLARKIKISGWIQIVFFTLCGAYLCLWDKKVNDLYDNLLFAVLCAVTIMLLSQKTYFTRIFATPFMRLIGHASFSIYLFHDGIIQLVGRYVTGLGGYTPWVQLAVATLLAIGLPVFFHFYAEKPLNQKAKEKGMALIERYLRPART